ncbi:transcription antitermination factor NusB [Aureibacillus halotolerans]|uniref:Transcription antitermination protein NusB n=1 Tax=Aureibacillus halotolerans TaxID=1508390 RepID=A0A4R6UAD8_9BACI|nr:transcription antitermination factor NusB [Aureibacillus halotolerans]TDQ41645.1 NusB antitermination factor [Aureibacillus halotolerans]
MNRHQAREFAFKILFQMDVSDTELEDAMQHALEEEEASDFCLQLIQGVLEHQAEIDVVITKHLKNWTIDRMANVDRTILRISLFELLYVEEIPFAVSINEAVELAKIYGDDEASKFVNGLLSNASKEI